MSVLNCCNFFAGSVLLVLMMKTMASGQVATGPAHLSGAFSPSSLYQQALMSPSSSLMPGQQIIGDIGDIWKSLREAILSASNASPCSKELLLIAKGGLNKEQWALKYFDSEPMKPPGLMAGNLKWYGDFDECLAIGPVTIANSSITITPKFCQIAIGNSKQSALGPTLFDPTTLGMLMLGVCLPNSCNLDALEELVNPLISNFSFEIRKDLSYCLLQDVPYTTELYVTASIFSSVCAILLVGLAVELAVRFGDWLRRLRSRWNINETKKSHDDGKEKLVDDEEAAGYVINGGSEVSSSSSSCPIASSSTDPILSSSTLENTLVETAIACSPFGNFQKIVDLSSKKQSYKDTNEPDLSGLNGIRALSLLWVILGHLYAFTIVGIDNLMVMTDLANRVSFMFVEAGLYAVDTFLFLSGFLAYHSLAPRFNKSSQPSSVAKTFLMSYLNRYIRLTPPYAALILLIVGLWPYIGNGPDYQQTVDVYCQKNWWANLMYIHNFVNAKSQCAAWTWYLSVDMQLSLLAPFAVLLFVRKQSLGWLVTGAALLAQVALCTTLTYVFHLPNSLFQPPQANATGPPPIGLNDFYTKMYIPFYTRMGPYIVGLMCCHLVVAHSSFLRRHIFSVRRLWLQGLLWLLAFALMLILTYAPFGVISGKYVDPIFVDAMYNSLTRPVWGLALCWLVLCVVFKKAGPIGSILEWPGWAIPARLSYAAYLLHPLVVFYYVQTQRQTIHSTDIVNIFLFFGISFSTLLIAVPFSTAFESPVIGIQRIFLKKK